MISCNRREGSARPVNEVAERLADRGHEVHLYARKVEDLDLEKVRWHPVVGPTWPAIADFWSYHITVNRRLSKACPYDIVHSIGPNTLLANVVTIQNVQPAKTKVLQRLGREEHVSWPRRFTRRLFLHVTSRAERQLCSVGANSKQRGAREESVCRRRPLFLPVSRGVEAELRAHHDLGDALVKVIPNAADTAVFKPLDFDLRAAWRQSQGLGSSDFVCIFPGGEWARKGLDLAIRALALIQNPLVKLFVAGDDPDRSRFINLAHQLQVGGRVVFGGFRKDIASAMASSDLLLFPSWYEAFSLATIEAAACGLPILASRINGTEDFIQPGLTGEFIEHDPEQIRSILEPLTTDLLRCRIMGEAARKVVETNYTWDRVAQLTEEAYREYLDGCGAKQSGRADSKGVRN